MTNTASSIPTAAEIFRPPPPVMWPSKGLVLDLVVELLPRIDDDLIADLVKQLALAILDREDELTAVRAVMAAGLALAFTQRNEIVRVKIRDAVRRRERSAP